MAASFISSSSGELGVHCSSLVRCTMFYLLLLGVFACVYIGKGQTKSEIGDRRQWLCRELTSEPESGSSASLWWLVSPFLCFVGHCIPSHRGLQMLTALAIEYLEENNLKSGRDLEQGSCILFTAFVLKDDFISRKCVCACIDPQQVAESN